jgi:hypothetical protein
MGKFRSRMIAIVGNEAISRTTHRELSLTGSSLAMMFYIKEGKAEFQVECADNYKHWDEFQAILDAFAESINAIES